MLDQESLLRSSDGLCSLSLSCPLSCIYFCLVAGFLLYALIAGIVDTCKPILDELDDVLEDLEVAMMEKPSRGLNKLV